MAIKKTVKSKSDTLNARYEVAELKAHAKALFGVRPEVVDGALYGSGNERYTVAEVKEKLINS